jgi:lipid-A-disaccharide synthase
MADLARRRPADRFVVAAVPHLPASIYTSILAGIANATVVVGDMRGVLAHSAAAVVTSGTATLETALLGVPQVVVYKGSPLSYQIAKRLIKVPYISLVNLIADGPLVPELIQAACTAEGIDATLATILQPERLADIRSGYAAVADALVSGGGADAAAMDLMADIRASIPR